MNVCIVCNRNHKLEISTVPTKAKSWGGDQLIHGRLPKTKFKTKSTGSGLDTESQAVDS